MEAQFESYTEYLWKYMGQTIKLSMQRVCPQKVLIPTPTEATGDTP